jgi:hypothetical protein
MDELADVGRDLVERLKATVDEKVREAIALRIRTKVDAARSDPDTSSRRWPFELIQNAHDASVRAGRQNISLYFDLTDGILRFEHDAAPFTMDEFAALLTGGSSKDFMSMETTGRFGTGFLVTHVLSEQVHVSGIIEYEGSYRSFGVDLDRPNDQDRLLQNVIESQESLLHTRLVENVEDEPTASFEYDVDDEAIAEAGLNALEEALPYLFATCQRLGEIHIRRGGDEVVWKRTSVSKQNLFLSKPTEFRVSRLDRRGNETEWRIVRAVGGAFARGAMVVALAKHGDGWAVRKPGNLPSVFRQLPLLGGPRLPGWAIVDGQFEVEQERRQIYLAGEKERPLREAFAALGGLMILANKEEWVDAHRIAHLALPPELTGETNVKVWTDVLSSAAAKLSTLPLVRTANGEKLPCVTEADDERCADFISRPESGPSYDELWELAASCTGADPPARDISEGWSEVVEGWEKLGVGATWVNLEEIGWRACANVDYLTDLRVDRDAIEWLSYYFEAVGKTWKASGTKKSHLDHIIPDQHGRLWDADKLKVDGGVAERTKEISADLGIDIEAQLLDQRLLESLSDLDFSAGLFAIREATTGELVEDDAVASLLHRLTVSLPDDQKMPEENENAVDASIDLLSHLWSTGGKAAQSSAWKIPFLATDGATHKPGVRRMMVPPVLAWPEAARKFATAYPPGRVLDERYAEQGNALLEALTAWGITYSSLVVPLDRDEIPERGLKPIATDPEEVAGASLREAKLSQIALLEPELINYCRQTRERAQALFGFVICFVAQADRSWRTVAQLPVKTPDGDKIVSLTPSLWLSDLRSKPWIPVEENGDVVHHAATSAFVRGLLDPLWLQGNPDGAELLVQHFGLDALDVRLLAATTDEETRQKLRDSLARIIEVVGSNSQVIEELAVKAQQRQRDVNLMRKLGLEVQKYVQKALEARNLHIDPDDYGYDFLVTVNEDDPDDLSWQFQVAEYMVEVKTTTTGEPRLTPLQAATCAKEPNKFVLCVVDLRNFQGDVHDAEWTADIVSEFCRLLPGTAIPTGKTLSFVEGAEESDVPIRNVSALRYAVRADIWEAGLDLDEWVETAFFAVPPKGAQA